jgi:hypothetical protein
LVNTSKASVTLRIAESDSKAQPDTSFAAPVLDSGAIDIVTGFYTLTFDNNVTEVVLETTLQAGTLYSFYVFDSGEELFVNVDVDGVLGSTQPEGR